MLPTIKPASAIEKKESLIILVKSGKNIPPNVLSEEEKKFVEKEFEAKRYTVIINQYERLVILHRLQEDKAPHIILETCRKAGEQAAASLNKQKKKNVIVLDEADKKNA